MQTATMQSATAALFEKVSIGCHELANSLVVAPLTRSRANQDGTVNPLMATYYAQRASAGLIISESTYVSAEGKSAINIPGLHTAEQTSSWRQVTDAVHAAGGRIYAQLVHAGRVSHPDLLPGEGTPVAPSAITPRAKTFTPEGMKDCPQPRELAASEIASVICSFAAAAVAAVASGFDGVEVHAGNGYLINQFLSPGANHRTDAYGGSARNRSRLAIEVTEAVTGAVGPDRVGVRIAPWNTAFGIERADDDVLYPELVRTLPAGLAYLHVREVDDRPLTVRLRSLWPGRLIVNPHPYGPDGGPATVAQAAEVLARGVADAVCLGTLFIANPDLPARIKAGGGYNTPNEAAYYWGGEVGYTDYPFLDV
jgi:N-ethylmaleimide reductase